VYKPDQLYHDHVELARQESEGGDQIAGAG
jgi:hypothetical protein